MTDPIYVKASNAVRLIRHDGNIYLVFTDSYMADMAYDIVIAINPNFTPCSFGDYSNAYFIKE